MGYRIKEVRESINMTQEELAEKSGVSRTTISALENGDPITTSKTLVSLNALVVANRTILYDRIKHLAKTYIKRGYITVEEYEDLKRMHKVYHDEMHGNGFLDGIMNEIEELEKRVL